MDTRERSHRYYLKHRERVIQRTSDYYYSHKAEVLVRQRRYKHEHVILYKNKPAIYGVSKAPEPINGLCPYCERKRQLLWHHWDASNPDNGVWMCPRCHVSIHWIKRHPKLKTLI